MEATLDIINDRIEIESICEEIESCRFELESCMQQLKQHGYTEAEIEQITSEGIIGDAAKLMGAIVRGLFEKVFALIKKIGQLFVKLFELIFGKKDSGGPTKHEKSSKVETKNKVEKLSAASQKNTQIKVAENDKQIELASKRLDCVPAICGSFVEDVLMETLQQQGITLPVAQRQSKTIRMVTQTINASLSKMVVDLVLDRPPQTPKDVVETADELVNKIMTYLPLNKLISELEKDTDKGFKLPMVIRSVDDVNQVLNIVTNLLQSCEAMKDMATEVTTTHLDDLRSWFEGEEWRDKPITDTQAIIDDIENLCIATWRDYTVDAMKLHRSDSNQLERVTRVLYIDNLDNDNIQAIQNSKSTQVIVPMLKTKKPSVVLAKNQLQNFVKSTNTPGARENMQSRINDIASHPCLRTNNLRYLQDIDAFRAELQTIKKNSAGDPLKADVAGRVNEVIKHIYKIARFSVGLAETAGQLLNQTGAALFKIASSALVDAKDVQNTLDNIRANQGYPGAVANIGDINKAIAAIEKKTGGHCTQNVGSLGQLLFVPVFDTIMYTLVVTDNMK